MNNKKPKMTAERQAELIELAHDAIIVRDPDSRVVFWNQGAEETYGFQKNEALGKVIHALLQTKFPISLEAVDQALMEQDKWAGELTHTRADGQTIVVASRLALQRNAAGEPTAILEINRDITSRKKAEEGLQTANDKLKKLVKDRSEELSLTVAQLQEEAKERQQAQEYLKESEEHFRALVTATADVVYRMSPDWSELLCLCGRNFISDTEKPSQTWLQKYIHPDDQPQLMAVVNEAIRTKSIFELEHRVRCVDGSLGWTSSRAIPLQDTNGEIVEWFGAASNITKRKRAEEEIRRLNEVLEQRVKERTVELQQTTRELESFSYTVAHDLKTPLRTIRGFSQMLLKEHAARLDEEGRRLLQIVVDNTQQMSALIDDLLNLARMACQQMRKVPLDLAAMAKGVFIRLQAQEPERDLLLIAKESPQAWGDSALLYQVLMNLIENSFKFTRDNKTTIIEVGGRAEGKENIYYVKDNGVGFKEEDNHKMFVVFQRLHSGEKYEGTGVGLATVQRIIQRHGGSVWADGRVNEGATIYFSLPQKAD